MSKEGKKKKWERGKHPGGRPTKYKPEYCQQLIDYFNQEPCRKTAIGYVANLLPSLEQFARDINVHVSTVYDWIDEKQPNYQKKFSEAFDKAKEARKNFLIQNGLLGLYNSSFAKFVAVNMTDMSDKQETEHSGKVVVMPSIILDNGEEAEYNVG